MTLPQNLLISPIKNIAKSPCTLIALKHPMSTCLSFLSNTTKISSVAKTKSDLVSINQQTVKTKVELLVFGTLEEQAKNKFNKNSPIEAEPWIQDLLPGFSFEKPSGKKGVYVIAFAKKKRLYIGEASDVTHEIGLHLGQNSLAIPEDFRDDLLQHGKKEFQRLALFTCGNMAISKNREVIETYLISLVGEAAYNIEKNLFGKRRVFKNLPITKSEIVGSLKEYGLDFPSYPFPTKGSYVYVLMHSITKRFYIGSSSITFHARFKCHKTTLAKLIFRLGEAKKGKPLLKVEAMSSILPLAQNMSDTNCNHFTVGALEVIDNISRARSPAFFFIYFVASTLKFN